MQIDGFEQEKKVVVVAATNRKQDLDPALVRYFYSSFFSYTYTHLKMYCPIMYEVHNMSFFFNSHAVGLI